MPCLALACLCSSLAVAQTRDVNFAVVGKHAGYEQVGSELPVRQYYSFFSEIFLADDTPLAEATLVRPDGREVKFTDQRKVVGPSRDQLLLVRGERRYNSVEELDREWPDGEYVFRYRRPGTNDTISIAVQLGEGEFPGGPWIWLEQQGEKIEADEVQPDLDLVVRFTPFVIALVDPREILDDLVFVITRDEEGYKVDHSGRPFQGQRFLLYSDDRHVVPAASLAPASRYAVSVEHATLPDTVRAEGVPALSTRAVTTVLEIHTLPPLPRIMD